MTQPRTIPACKDYPGLLEIIREGRTIIVIGDPALGAAVAEAAFKNKETHDAR